MGLRSIAGAGAHETLVANEQALTVPEPDGFIRCPKPNGLDGARADALHNTSTGNSSLGRSNAALSSAAFKLAIFCWVFHLPSVKLTVAHLR
jgi:hypothetical protein